VSVDVRQYPLVCVGAILSGTPMNMGLAG
jgi:hypothetical protein